MAEKTKGLTYGADSISVLEGLEAVRMRPAMYIGDTDERGLHHLIWEVVDNSVDEALAGHATFCRVTIHEDGSVRVEDDGRGIPIGMHPTEGVPAVEVVLTKLHAGGKFDHDAYKVSGGLHGVGVSCVNALSEWLTVEVHKDGKVHSMGFERGNRTKELEVVGDTDRSGTAVTFKPDAEIFSTVEIVHEIVQKRLRETAYLMGTRGLTLECIDERTGAKDTFSFPEGLMTFVSHLNKNKTALHPTWCTSRRRPNRRRIRRRSTRSSWRCSTPTATRRPSTPSSTTSTRTAVVRTSPGLKAALTRTLNSYGKQEKLLKDPEKVPSGDDFREGLTAVLSIKVPDPQFEGQTKDKLGNREAQGIVESIVGEVFATYLEEHNAAAKAIVNKAIRAQQARDAARKARDLVRRKSALASGNLPGKLSDCQSSNLDETELYIVEGDSAGGPAKMGRDRRYQAILPIKGKILNVEKARLDKMLGHVEIQLIISALGCGIGTDFDIEKLRYGKTIIMTDADVDGSHIRTLLLTFFFRQMPQLIEHGRLYIAQPPLYKVSHGKKSTYITDDASLRRYLIERGIGSVIIEDRNAKREFQGAELKELCSELDKVKELVEASAPVWAQMDVDDLLARWNGEHLPQQWAQIGKEQHFFDSLEELENFIELQKAANGAEFTVYTGPDSGVSRRDANAVVAHLAHVEELVRLCKSLEGRGLVFQGGGDWSVRGGKEEVDCKSLAELAATVQKSAQGQIDLQRYKGLGEMNADQLWESTMDPEKRTLYRVTLDDAISADEIFTVLMSDGVEARREYIEQHALEVTNLDV